MSTSRIIHIHLVYHFPCWDKHPHIYLTSSSISCGYQT